MSSSRSWRESVRAWLAVVTACWALIPCSHAAEPLVAEVVVNAPVESVWNTFTTAEGYRMLGAAQAEIDLRLGGRLRTHGTTDGAAAKEPVDEWEILVFDPQHLLAFKPLRVEPDASGSWSIVYFNSIAAESTHIRVVLLGDHDSPASRNAARALLERTRAALERLVKQHRPMCAHCERPK